MKIVEKKGRVYINDLDIEEVLSNRKYVMNYINSEIGYLESIKNNKDLWKPEYNTRIEVLKELSGMFKLRR